MNALLPLPDVGVRPVSGSGSSPGREAVHLDYRRLLGADEWRSLPAAVRKRFSAAMGPDVTYRGAMRVVHANRAGRCLAWLGRFLGEPLIALTGTDIPAHVRVFTDLRGGSVWERAYCFPGRDTRVVRSAKRPDRDGALVECLGLGLRMRLELSGTPGELRFVSTGYYWLVAGVRIPLPRRWFPGETTVVHRDEGAGRFRFLLSIDHPWLGRLVYQEGVFVDPEEK